MVMPAVTRIAINIKLIYAAVTDLNFISVAVIGSGKFIRFALLVAFIAIHAILAVITVQMRVNLIAASYA